MQVFGLWPYVVREMSHRKLNCILGLLSVAAGAGCLVGALTLLRGHDIRTNGILDAKRTEVKRQMVQLEDDFRKITKGLGFNVLILPKDQNLADLYADDYANKFMPEEYATKLANSRVITINHLLPILQIKAKWPEQNRTVIFMGVREEVPILDAKHKPPIMDPVSSGTLVLGHELHKSLGLAPGDAVMLMGKEFKVAKAYPERGNKDDITIWINLPEAQALFHKEGMINAIMALECHCAADRLAMIRSEIAAILPETQVIELVTQALARAESRNKAAETAKTALLTETAHYAAMRGEQEHFAAILIPLVLLGSAAGIGFLAFANVRDRRTEIGLLRAVGIRTNQVLSLFLSRALLLGFSGAILGYLAGFVGALYIGGMRDIATLKLLFSPEIPLLVLIGSPLWAGISSWVPAVLAARQDPAAVLREE